MTQTSECTSAGLWGIRGLHHPYLPASQILNTSGVNSHPKLFCGTWQSIDTAGGRELTSTSRRVYCKRCQSLPLFCFGYQGTSSPPLLLPVRSAAWQGALFLRWLHTSSLTQLLLGEAELHLPRKTLAPSPLVGLKHTRAKSAYSHGHSNGVRGSGRSDARTRSRVCRRRRTPREHPRQLRALASALARSLRPTCRRCRCEPSPFLFVPGHASRAIATGLGVGLEQIWCSTHGSTAL